MPSHSPDADRDAISSLLNLWFAEGMEGKWFRGGEAFDDELRARFGPLHQRACAGELSAWAETAEGALALIILLDQLSRNLNRGTPEAFAQDDKALAIALYAIDRGWDARFSERERQFFYLPLMHSESPTIQARCLALYSEMSDENALKFAREHHDIIARFGRFPHRNKILGRVATAEEHEFLKTHEGF